MARRKKLYEGKAKIIYEGPEPGTVVQYFKDDATAFNNKKKGTITGKGVLNNRISEYLMLKLGEIGIPTHFVRRLNMREQLVRHVEIIPIEVVMRNVAAGSLSNRFSIPEGTPLPRSIIEYYYKNDELDDPMITEEHITAFGWATISEIDEILNLSLRINDFLSGLMLGIGIRLVDFKMEFGRIYHEDGDVQIVLADEINRASPRTQSVLLEAMAEGQVSIDGNLMNLEALFFVIATQNPVEYQGTFPLPEAQLDRFLMCLKIGYPGYLKELDIAAARQRTAAQLQALVTEDELLELFQNVAALVVAPEILQYAVNITTATRANPDFVLGASPRASMDLVKAGRALAYIRQRDYVIPDDIKELAPWILGHRLILSAEARMEKKDVYRIITQLLKQVHVPKNISLA